MTIDFGTQTRLYLGLYEIELNQYLRRLCLSGRRSFDVGSQFGYDALVIAKLTDNQVVAIECEPTLVDMIKESISHNDKLGANIECRTAFITRATNASLGHLSLDDLADATFVPDFVKMDIEGGEADALDGFHTVLSTRKPDMIIEVHSAELEERCLRTLSGYGYNLRVVDQRRWLADFRPIAHNRWIVAEA